MKRTYRIADLITNLGVSRTTIWRWVRAGILPPPIRLGSTPIWPAEVIDALLAGNAHQ